MVSKDAMVTRCDIAVLIAIVDHCNPEGMCFPGVDTIAKKSQVSRRNVFRSIRRLEALGYIWIERDSYKSNVYTVDFRLVAADS